MKTSGSNFELIMQEVLKQKQLLEELLTENDELHRQLAELREGRGIFVDILGNRFPLLVEPAGVSPAAVTTIGADLSRQETTAIPGEAVPFSLPETPVPTTAHDVAEAQENQSPLATPTMSNFLEDALLDEFANASTRQMEQVAVWSGPVTNPPSFDDREKETLRRELSGSFLLE